MESSKEKNVVNVDYVSVYGRLITEGHPQFKKMLNRADKKRVYDRENLVIPIFEIVFESSKPRHIIRKMVKDSLNDSIDDSDVQEVMFKYSTEDVLSEEPYNEPSSVSVKVGDVGVTQSGDGIIADFDFEPLIDIY